MEYAILIYEENTRIETLIVNEKQMFDFLQDHKDDKKFIVMKLEIILDFS